MITLLLCNGKYVLVELVKMKSFFVLFLLNLLPNNLSFL